MPVKFCWMCLLILPALLLTAAELHIGGATTSITPDEPVAISGQMHIERGDWDTGFSIIHY